MKHLFILLLLLNFYFVSAQTAAPDYLDSNDVALLFSEQVKLDNGIRFPIFRAYPYVDEVGAHVLVLTERLDKNNDSIVAFCFRVNAGGNIEKLEWKITDFIEAHKENMHTEETSIWFWTKFLHLDDLDRNGTIDPVLVYGTSADNGIDDGRLKILVFLNGQKIGIRHQNSPMDFGRFTKVDASFYEIPMYCQGQIKLLMNVISDANKVIFPAGWEEAMTAKKLIFDEN